MGNNLQPSSRTVTILLCTCNGEHYLAEQLDSIEAQEYPHWRVLASDDGSRDNTQDILQTYRRRWSDNRLTFFAGPSQGYVANFLFVTRRAGGSTDYYAWADQDDIWEADKLRRATERLGGVPMKTPALYCTRTRIIDADNNTKGLSPRFSKPPSFANALVQNIASGNTIVFNNAARELLLETGTCTDIVIHDWWLYLIVSGCGGYVFYDPHPTLRYRQHGGNEIGIKNSGRDRANRVRVMLKGRFRHWNERNIEALKQLSHRLTPENRRILDTFDAARNSSFLPRLIGLKRSGVYRQTLLDELGLVTAAAFGRI